MIDDANLAKWKRLAEETTPGPWVADFTAPSGGTVYASDDRKIAECMERANLDRQHTGKLSRMAPIGREACAANTMLIAHARKAVPALIVEVERLRQEVAALLAAAIAYRDLCACYRLGDRPSEAFFRRLDAAAKTLAL